MVPVCSLLISDLVGLCGGFVPQLSSLLPWLSWRGMSEHPALREKLQGRSPAERQEGLGFLFRAATMRSVHLPKVRV